MTLRDGFPAVSNAADQFDIRRDLAGLIWLGSDGVIRSGVFPRSASQIIVTGRSDMKVDVAPFEAVIDRYGPVLIQNDGTIQSAALAAAPASNSRIDVVWVKQNETAAPVGDATDGPVIGVTTGTPAVSPTVPSIPVGAMALAQVLVPSGASTTSSSGVVITQVFPFTTTADGMLWIRSSGDLPANAPLGARAMGVSDSKTWTNTLSGWRQDDTGWQTSFSGWTWGNGFGQASLDYGGYLRARWRRINDLMILDGGVSLGTTQGSPVPVVLPPSGMRNVSGGRVNQNVNGAFYGVDSTGNVLGQGSAASFLYGHAEWYIS